MKIKSCGLSDHHSISTAQSFPFSVVHPCNLSLGLQLFCPASSAQLLCNPHDTAGSRDAQPPPILPLLSTALLTLFRAEHWLGGEGGNFQQLFRPTTLSYPQRSSPSYTHPPSQYHPPCKYSTFFISTVPGTPPFKSSENKHATRCPTTYFLRPEPPPGGGEEYVARACYAGAREGPQ